MVEKNFKFDSLTSSFVFDEVRLSHATKQEDLNPFDIEYYNDYQDKYIYTFKQRLFFNNNNFTVTAVFKSSKIWLIEIHPEQAITIANKSIGPIYQELYANMLASNIIEATRIQFVPNKSLRLEFL